MTQARTIIRYNKDLLETDAKLVRAAGALPPCEPRDQTQWANTLGFCAATLEHAGAGAGDRAGRGASRRSRGAHYKPDFPERDDKNWLKTTKATFAPDADEPKFEFEPVDVSLIKPRPRRYDAAK